MSALVQKLGGEGAQDGPAAAGPVPVQTKRCGALSTSTAIAVPSVLMPISATEAGSASSCSHRPGSVRRSSFGNAVVFASRWCSFSVLCLVNRVVSQGWGDRVCRSGQVPVRGRRRAGRSVEVGGAGGGAGPVAGPALEVADAVEEFGAAPADRLGEGPVVGAGIAQDGDGDVRQVALVGLAESHRLIVIDRGRV